MSSHKTTESLRDLAGLVLEHMSQDSGPADCEPYTGWAVDLARDVSWLLDEMGNDGKRSPGRLSEIRERAEKSATKAWRDDGTFDRHAREDVLWLLSEVERLRQERGRQQDFIDRKSLEDNYAGYGEILESLTAERDAALAEVERARKVVEAARKFVQPDGSLAGRVTEDRLRAALALPREETQAG